MRVQLRDATPADVHAAVERARDAAATVPGPLTGFVGGRGTFEGDQEKIPVWARIVCPGVRQLRQHARAARGAAAAAAAAVNATAAAHFSAADQGCVAA